jgi:hypothetical protein
MCICHVSGLELEGDKKLAGVSRPARAGRRQPRSGRKTSDLSVGEEAPHEPQQPSTRSPGASSGAILHVRRSNSRPEDSQRSSHALSPTRQRSSWPVAISRPSSLAVKRTSPIGVCTPWLTPFPSAIGVPLLAKSLGMR